jgi:hypothetical protein
MPPLAALLYPFLLEAFHASIVPLINGRTAEPALQAAAAARFCCWPSPRRSGRCSRLWRSARLLRRAWRNAVADRDFGEIFGAPIEEVRFAQDSPVEGGFELLVPRAKVCSGEHVTCPGAQAEEAQLLIHSARTQTRARRHTGSAPAHPRAR